MQFTYEDLIQEYLANRKKKSALKQEYEAKVKEIDNFQDMVETFFALESDKTTLKNFKTAYGTAYKYRAASVKTADKAEFAGFIIENRQWGLLDARPVKATCLTWMDDCGIPPPGLKIERFERIGVLSPGETLKIEDN